MKRVDEAWAIDTRSDEGHGLIGKYWWVEGRPPNVPMNLQGSTVSLFKTRKDARFALLSVKRSFPKAQVVRVKITIEWER